MRPDATRERAPAAAVSGVGAAELRTIPGMAVANTKPDPRIRSLSGNDLRQRFLDFFAARGHNIVPSASLEIGRASCRERVCQYV